MCKPKPNVLQECVIQLLMCLNLSRYLNNWVLWAIDGRTHVSICPPPSSQTSSGVHLTGRATSPWWCRPSWIFMRRSWIFTSEPGNVQNSRIFKTLDFRRVSNVESCSYQTILTWTVFVDTLWSWMTLHTHYYLPRLVHRVGLFLSMQTPIKENSAVHWAGWWWWIASVCSYEWFLETVIRDWDEIRAIVTRTPRKTVVCTPPISGL